MNYDWKMAILPDQMSARFINAALTKLAVDCDPKNLIITVPFRFVDKNGGGLILKAKLSEGGAMNYKSPYHKILAEECNGIVLGELGAALNRAINKIARAAAEDAYVRAAGFVRSHQMITDPNIVADKILEFAAAEDLFSTSVRRRSANGDVLLYVGPSTRSGRDRRADWPANHVGEHWGRRKGRERRGA